MRYVIPVDQHPGHVHVDLSGLPSATRLAVLGAMANHALHEVDLAKAVHGEGEGADPRFPELNALVDRVRTTWSWWARRLADHLAALLGSGAPPEKVEEAIAEHDAGVTAAITGQVPARDRDVVVDLVAAGALPADLATSAPIPTAVRLGMAHDPINPRGVAAPTVHPLTRPLSPNELGAMAYARKRAAIYMRRPIAGLHATVDLVALDSAPVSRRLPAIERKLVGDVIEQAIADRTPVGQVAKQLRAAVQGTSLSNDMDRVAITELAFAHNHGALIGLEASIPPGSDPMVYKIVNPGACADCRRIWGHPANPVRYRLSVVKAGDNFGKSHGQWGPTVGPVHPRCFPAGVVITTARGDVPIERVRIGDLVLTHRMRWRRVTTTMSRAFDGRLFRVNGIPVTDEHPFLTSRGWQPAERLTLADDLRQPADVRFSDPDDRPSLRAEVRFLWDVLGHLLGRGVPVPAIDFDRHLHARDGQIHQVAADLKGWFGGDAEGRERVMKLAFQFGMESAGLPADHSPHSRLGEDATTRGAVRGGYPGLSGSLAHPSPHLAAGLASGAWRDASGAEAVPDPIAADVQTPSHCEHGQPLLHVEANDLVDRNVGSRVGSLLHVPVRNLSSRWWAGTVYNFAVDEDESYVADGLVAHNCTCPPLLIWNDAVHDAVQDVAEELRRIYGR